MLDEGLVKHPPRVGNLSTVRACRLELARVYKDARIGKIDPADGSRLAFILSQIAKLIETSDLEKRVADIESRLVVADTHEPGNSSHTH